MPSKASLLGAAEPNSDILILINLIRTATEFKADTKEMAKICNISHEKNVPRRINAIVASHGFKFERGRIVEQDGSATNKDQGGGGERNVKKTTKTSKKEAKASKIKEPKMPKLNKKRRVEETEPEDFDADVAEDGDGTVET